MALADTAALVVQLKLDDKLSGGLGRVNAQLSQLQAGANQVGKGVGQIGAGLAHIGTIAATGFAIGVGAAVKVAGDFEAQLNTINTIAKLNDQQLTTLGTGIRDTFKQTGAPLEELTAAYYDLLSAGIKVGDAQSVLNTAVKLGIGGLATTKEAVDLLTTAINSYGLNSSQAAQASDIFAAAVRDGKVTVSELNASFADVAPLASQVGIKLEEIGAAYATLTARGVPATEVGTQFNRAIIELLKPGPDLVKILDGLGESSFEASIKQKGLVATLQDIRTEAQKQGIPFQDLFGRLEAYKFALATTGENQGKFTAELSAMGAAAGETNAQFEERQKGLNFQLARLKALATDAGITIGTALIPKLVPLVETLNTFIADNQDKISTFGQKLADGLGAFADKLKTIDFGPLISGLKIASDIAKTAYGFFTSLPPALQGAIISGFALNKLSGGLLGKGVGNLLGGGLKLIFERGNTPLRPLYVQNVGLPGTGGIPAAGKLGLGGILGGLSLALVGDLIFGQIAAEINKRINPTGFNFNEIAGQSGNFSNPQAADTFARKLADKLDLPLDKVKQKIVDAVNNQGLTFDQAVASLRNIDTNTARTANTKDDVAREREARGLLPFNTQDAVVRELQARGLKLDDAALIAALEKTSEFGKAGVGTTIEHGPLTGSDPFGQQALELFRQAEFPRQGRTLGEIQRHILAAEEVQKQYLAQGDTQGAKLIQVTIDGLKALLTGTDKVYQITQSAAQKRAETANRLNRLLDPLPGGIAALVAKDFSPTFSPTVNVMNTVDDTARERQARGLSDVNDTLKIELPKLESESTKSRATSEDLYHLQQAEQGIRSAEAARQITLLESLKLPLGLGNAIASQIRDRVERQQSTASAMLERLRGVEMATRATAEKKWTATFSPTIVNNNTVNAQLSVTQALQTITISNSIRYDGKLVPI